MGTPPCFSAIFTKGNNFCDFLFAALDEIALPNSGILLMERICSLGANSFLYELTPIEKIGRNKSGRVASPESVPFYLNRCLMLLSQKKGHYLSEG